MIYITQLIYVREGQEDVFQGFEDSVLPLMETYGGHMLLRLRPSDDSVVARQGDKPYEVHVITFPDDAALAGFSHDERRKAFLHLKEASVKSVLLVRGEAIG